MDRAWRHAALPSEARAWPSGQLAAWLPRDPSSLPLFSPFAVTFTEASCVGCSGGHCPGVDTGFLPHQSLTLSQTGKPQLSHVFGLLRGLVPCGSTTNCHELEGLNQEELSLLQF